MPDSLPCRQLSNSDPVRSWLSAGKAGFRSPEEGKAQSAQRTKRGSTKDADVRPGAGGHLPVGRCEGASVAGARLRLRLQMLESSRPGLS